MKSFRPDKVASVIREIVSEMISSKLQDPRISPLASVTRVEVSGDLQFAKVHVSVLGAEADGRRTLRGLEHAAGHIQRAVAKGLSTRQCPHLRFVLDGSLKKAAEIVSIIDASMPPAVEAVEDEALEEDIADDAPGDDIDDDTQHPDGVSA